MASCLGLYIEKNIIKYAKVTKDKDITKIEAFGVKVYDDLSKTIAQIVEETYSFKIPISINLSDEKYQYFDMFKLLTKSDLNKSIKTEFEVYCNENKFNQNVFESRDLVVPSATDKDRLKIIYVFENKIELNKESKEFEKYRLNSMFPTAMTIPTIIGNNIEDNCLIVNLEENTTVTRVLDKNIYDIEKIELGSKDILYKINAKENSYLKAYEICKNTTIYTSEGKGLQDLETDYLEDIMPTLYEIVGKVMKIVNESENKIDKIYLTGTLALINNIDLYFQEYLADIKCEIIKPSFLQITPDINIKDYIEVNTPISLALTALGEGLSGINFKTPGAVEKLIAITDKLDSRVNFEVKDKKAKNKNSNKKPSKFKLDFNVNIKNDLGTSLDNIEFILLKVIIAVFAVFIIYCAFSNNINIKIEETISEAESVISQTNSQISAAESEVSSIESKTSEYETKITNLEEINDRITDISESKNMIPNLLNHIMFVIPEGVQILSIENTESRHIVIEMQSDQYEQLGYFTAKLKTEAILVDVISSASEKSGGVIKMTIEGDIP